MDISLPVRVCFHLTRFCVNWKPPQRTHALDAGYNRSEVIVLFTMLGLSGGAFVRIVRVGNVIGELRGTRIGNNRCRIMVHKRMVMRSVVNDAVAWVGAAAARGDDECHHESVEGLSL